MKFTAILSGAVLLALEAGQAFAAPGEVAPRDGGHKPRGTEFCCVGLQGTKDNHHTEWFYAPFDINRLQNNNVFNVVDDCWLVVSYIDKNAVSRRPPSKGGCANLKLTKTPGKCDNKGILWGGVRESRECEAARARQPQNFD
ncbi:hypothetical protein E4U42_000881 [Claviceps africana]|uniref:Small secreted protein n=1 Tax=Claviceps africana TaxID=83212 RepID=A0A8K0J4X8_9HYPO|nr:hypothetical protein E4U42_000881 [Claviceps africana]